MPKYLIEVSQPAKVAARQIAASVRTIGSHFATHARWQECNGMATGTLVVEAEDWQWAFHVVPPTMRPGANIVQLEAPATQAASAPATSNRSPMSYPLAA